MAKCEKPGKALAILLFIYFFTCKRGTCTPHFWIFVSCERYIFVCDFFQNYIYGRIL